MYPVSAALLAALSTDHVPAFLAELYLDGAYVAEVPFESGSVTVDSRRAVLRSCTLEVVGDATRTLDDLWALLAVPGAELKLYRGVALPDGPELVPLGVFVISEPEGPALGALGSIAINGDDRSVRIATARFTVPYAIAAGADLADAGADLLTSRWADCPIGFSAADTGALTVSAALLLDAGESSDPWKEAQALFAAYGYDLYFDPDGVAQVRSIPDPATTTPCILYGNGEASVLIDAKRRVSYAETYSGIVVTGEGTEVAVPVHSERWDMDPASPTYADGPFGRRPFFYSSPLITTQAMADTAADTMLPKHTARSSTLTWSQLVNPAHDVLDVVGITDAAGVVTPYVLDTLTVPLTAGEVMAATTRATGVV